MTISDNDKKSVSESEHPDATALGSCRSCSCTRFTPDPTDPDTCMSPGNYPNLCGHSRSSHR